MQENKLPLVLVVEDDEALRASLKAKLEEMEYKVMESSELAHARMALKNQKFCCITLDQKLKGGEGDTLLTLMRENPDHPNHATPVLFISGFLDKDLLQKVSGKVSAAMVKPFEIAEFAEKLKQICPLK